MPTACVGFVDGGDWVRPFSGILRMRQAHRHCRRIRTCGHGARLNLRCACLSSASNDTKLTKEASLFYLIRSKCTLPRCDDYTVSIVRTGPFIHDLTRHEARRHPLVAAVPRRRSGTVADRATALRRARECAQPSGGRSRAMAARVASRSLVRIDGGAVCRRGERKHPRGANRHFPQICLLCEWHAPVFSSRRRGKDSVR